MGSIPIHPVKNMKTKLCTRCKKEKDIEEFSWENREYNIRQRRCKSCQKKLSTRHYERNKESYRLRSKIRREQNKKWIDAYLSDHPCIDCGEQNLEILEFDHTTEKDIIVSHMYGFSIDRIKKEVERCEIRCANCHRRKTMKELESIKYYLSLGENKDYSSCKQTSRAKSQRKERLVAIKYVFDYLKQHPCVDCGETDPLVLEFDHNNREDKRLEIVKILQRKYWDLEFLEEEISKCEVRCVNCHKKRTLRQFERN